MKKYSASISLSVGLAEEQPYHTVEFEAETTDEVFSKIVSAGKWFHYRRKGKVNGKEYEIHSVIQVTQITDIYIREVLEEPK